MSTLLAVDMGLKCGLAAFGVDGRLIWYRSHNFGTNARLRQAVHSIIADLPDLAYIAIEGGGPIAEIWKREAARKGIQVIQIAAEQWRDKLLLAREQRSGAQAKQVAGLMAKRVIEWSGAPRPTSLRHDAAEAILIGIYGVISVGWLKQTPAQLRRTAKQPN